jgi:hypothetical protein
MLTLQKKTMGNEIEIYNEPDLYSRSLVYTVMADNIQVPVLEFQPSENPVSAFFEYHKDENPPDRNFIWRTHYARFSFSGTIRVRVSIKGSISAFRILPACRGINGAVNGTTLSFTLSSRQYLVIKINELENLIILADPIEEGRPSWGIRGSSISWITVWTTRTVKT